MMIKISLKIILSIVKFKFFHSFKGSKKFKTFSLVWSVVAILGGHVVRTHSEQSPQSAG